MKNIRFYTDINDIRKEKWEDFYLKNKSSNIFQSFEMYEFWSRLKAAESFIFFLESDTGECLAFCTGAIVFKGKGRIKFQSMSALIYGGPLISENSNKKEILNILFPKIEKYLRFKSKSIEFRNLFLDIDFKEVFQKRKWKYTPKVNYLVNLTSEAEVFGGFDRNKRNKIRRAYRTGVEISHRKSRKNIEGIYKILKDIYKKNFDEFLLPLPDLDFLTNLIKLEKSGLTTVIYNDEIIGGEFFLLDHKTIYGWFGGGLNKEYKNQSPMSVSNWATMQYGIKKNLQYFDFGGAGIKGKENRLRLYKSAFGGKLIENGMFSKINNKYVYKVENKIYRLIKYFGLFYDI